MKYVVVVIFGFLFISCRKEAPKENVTEVREEVAVTDSVQESAGLKALIAEFTKEKEAVMKQLESASPEEANAIYESYEKANGKIIDRIYKSESKLIGDYYSYFGDGNSATQPDSIVQKKTTIESAGLEFWDIGEGMIELRPVPDFYFNIFKKYVTDDYREFLSLIATDEADLWSADAGIIIPWKALAQRVLNWENFLKKYPDSKLVQLAIVNYKMYQISYISGQDNTPTYEHSNNMLYDENIAEFKRFIKQYPDSPTAKLAQQMLDNNGKGFKAVEEPLQTEFDAAYSAFN